MKSFLISSPSETLRKDNINLLLKQLPNTQIIEAIYPDHLHVPFLEKIKTISKRRTGHALVNGEIGCLLSHRKAWQKIATEKNVNEFYLILESDSIINDLPALENLIKNSIPLYNNDKFIFFFGAWLGHMKLFRSTKQVSDKNHIIGKPFIKTVYCSYGYGLNLQTAKYLLKQTNKVAYPVDQFKRFVTPTEINLWGVIPEIISAVELGSYINQSSLKRWQRKLFMNLLGIKNSIICFFK